MDVACENGHAGIVKAYMPRYMQFKILCDVQDVSGEESVARPSTNFNSINNSTIRPLANSQTAI